jgi:lysophospholipase L1-like esterase
MPTPHRRSRTRAKLLAALLALSIGLVLAVVGSELLVRALFHRSMDYQMEMWKYAVRIKSPSDIPGLHFEHAPDASEHLMGVELRTNALGFRGGPIEPEKPDDVFRIAVAGDSLTLGWGAAEADTFVVRLAQLLQAEPPPGFADDVRFETFNLGVGNYNTTQEVTRLEARGLPLDPDLIVLAYYINDAEPTAQPGEDPFLAFSYLYVFLTTRLGAASTRNAPNYADYYRSLYADDQPGWQATRAAIARLGEISREHGIPAVLFILPELHVLEHEYPFEDVHARVLGAAEAAGVPAVDLLEVFRGFAPEENLWVSPTDAHPNGLAHGMIAEGMHRALRAGVVPLTPPAPQSGGPSSAE